MKRKALLRHLRQSGCYLKREGSAHSLWMNPLTGAVETVPRHSEISDKLAKKICKGLGIPEAKKWNNSEKDEELFTLTRSPSGPIIEAAELNQYNQNNIR